MTVGDYVHADSYCYPTAGLGPAQAFAAKGE
jgi:hypothetical protein